MINQQKQQHSSKTKNVKTTRDKTKKLKVKNIKEKTSKQGAPPTPQEKTKRQRERFKQ